MMKIEKKYLVGGCVAIIAIVLVAGIVLRQKISAKPVALTKITGEIESVSNDKSSLIVKTDAITYTANVTKIKTIKNSAGEKIFIDDIKAGDKIELRTRTSLKGGQVTTIDAYSLKDLSVSGSSADTTADTADNKK